MKISSDLRDYWQQGLRLQTVVDLRPNSIKEITNKITKEECIAGKIQEQELIDKLAEKGRTVVVAPYYAENNGNYFIPFYLIAEVEPDGNLTSNLIDAFPVIPNCVVEPANLEPIILGSVEDFDNYLSVSPPPWSEIASELSWESQLEYAHDMLDSVTKGAWKWHLSNVQYELQSGALIFSLSDVFSEQKLDLSLLDKKSKVELIEAERSSGKSECITKILANDWIEAGVKQAPSPQHVWLQHNSKVRYTTINDCVSDDESWTKEGKEDYLSKTSMYFSEDVVDLTDAKKLWHKKLSEVFNSYIRGKQAMRNSKDLDKRLQDKYSDKGGINERIHSLQNHVQRANANVRHVHVLYAIWKRQVELLPSWPKLLNAVPGVQRQRLSRLYDFFAQNFPKEDVSGQNLSELKVSMRNRIKKAEKTVDFIEDTIHQAKNELQQQTLLRDKCIGWAKSEDPTILRIKDVEKLLDKTLWHELIELALRYWEAEDFISTTVNDVTDIDLLVIERAEYVSPMQAAILLAKSQRAIIMGSYSEISSPRFPVQIDYELCKHFNLSSNDADYEDLQFDGMLASQGNLWRLATSKRDPEQRLLKPTIRQPYFDYMTVEAKSEPYLGSRVNNAEAETIVHWVLENEAQSNEVAIYTSFSAQASQIRIALKSHGINNIPVLLIQSPSFIKKPITLFSPVYTREDKAPYCFDRGNEMLNNMIDNTLQRLIVIGDVTIFKPEMHSAAGHFAKNLFKLTEVDRV